jgi:hypothetical protein
MQNFYFDSIVLDIDRFICPVILLANALAIGYEVAGGMGFMRQLFIFIIASLQFSLQLVPCLLRLQPDKGLL